MLPSNAAASRGRPKHGANGPAYRDLQRNTRCYVVRYTKNYHKMQAADFVLDLLNDPAFAAVFEVGAGRAGGEGGRPGRSHHTHFELCSLSSARCIRMRPLLCVGA